MSRVDDALLRVTRAHFAASRIFSNSAKTSIRQGLLAIQIARGEFRLQKIIRARVTAFALASRRTAISARLK
jgi:hypothetical protein